MAIFRARFPYNTKRMWVALHAGDCTAAKDTNDYAAWDLDAQTLPDALEELERTQDLKARGIPVRLAECVGGTQHRIR